MQNFTDRSVNKALEKLANMLFDRGVEVQPLSRTGLENTALKKSPRIRIQALNRESVNLPLGPTYP